MKNTIYYLFLSCILIAGCSESILCGPPMISKVEVNSDSTQDHSSGTYKVYLKSSSGCDPVFYSYEPFNSGDFMVTLSNLQSMIDKKTKPYLDTIATKNRCIERLERENEAMQRQLDEKILLIRFLTGK